MTWPDIQQRITRNLSHGLKREKLFSFKARTLLQEGHYEFHFNHHRGLETTGRDLLKIIEAVSQKNMHDSVSPFFPPKMRK